MDHEEGRRGAKKMEDLKLDNVALKSFIEKEWDSHIIDTLCEYIKIPNQSPLFDKAVLTNGHMDKAVALFVNWVKEQKLTGLSIKVVRSEGRTPVILTTIEGDGKTDDTVLLYGHLDKQPPLASEWAEGLSPYTPVIKEGKLYGRGGADDGYAIFSAISAIKAIQKQKISHARCVILIEASEESGSPDLEFYVESLKDDIGTPSLVICLDSGCGNYEQLWLTTSLRGNVTAELKVRILKEGVHSGAASGVVPSTFRIQRILLDRIEDAKTGKMLDDLYCEIPKHHIAAAKEIAETLGDEIFKNFPWIEGGKTVSDDLVETILNRTWRPTLCVTGASGLPSLADAGNVLRQETAFKLSIRTPPLVNTEKVGKALHKALTSDPPYGAKVGFVVEKSGKGWMAPAHEEWLDKAVTDSSMAFFKKPVRYIGEGGSIPFMAMLGERFPSTQFVILGVLGPQSNAHGPNEFLHIQMAKNVTCCVAAIIARHFSRTAGKDQDKDKDEEGAKRRRVERSKI